MGSAAVARAAGTAERAQGYAKERAAAIAASAGWVAPHEIELIEIEVARAFIMGWAARDEETAVGRLPGPRRRRDRK